MKGKIRIRKIDYVIEEFGHCNLTVLKSCSSDGWLNGSYQYEMIVL